MFYDFQEIVTTSAQVHKLWMNLQDIKKLRRKPLLVTPQQQTSTNLATLTKLRRNTTNGYAVTIFKEINRDMLMYWQE